MNEKVLRDQAEGYVRAIQWNLHYYYDGCVRKDIATLWKEAKPFKYKFNLRLRHVGLDFSDCI